MTHYQPHINDIPLGEDELHLWFSIPEAIEEPKLLDDYLTILDEEERAQQKRFYFDRHRQQYLVSHALVRCTLSRYLNVEPHAWTFTKNQFGRPDAVIPSGMKPIQYNLSHTEGLVVCGILVHREMGVDVEDTERRGKTVEIADSFFSPSEIADLNQLPSEFQRDRFFDYWTLKEAYMKARGIGLSLGLENFSFRLRRHEPITIAFTDKIQDRPQSWQFALLRPTVRHRAALAVRRENQNDLTVRVFETVPLKEERELLNAIVPLDQIRS